MTYLVLARKWRPRSFDTLIGQDHVVRALTHALSTQRLHHAWLFTGTRGVGKTTLSRILAKSLNCETGITATPCGVCQACTEIDAGRFVDYVELDAASNRGVDEMTQLLEQAIYAPGSGRFKVYMIDEVHMLTGHAFNAMLKTLEEPPPHVKFILATTDPQKIPVTVLSRCLQFNLKQMTAEAIVGHLQGVLDQEQIQYETPALRLLAQAAAGSMRDALSLTDQAIAYSAGNLTGDAVQGMLGTIDQRHLVTLLQALAQGDATQVLAVADELAVRGLSYSGALGDLAVLLSRVAIEQRLPGTTPADDPLAADIASLASLLQADALQLFYAVAVHSRGELSLAPDEYAGFVMACLRMLSLLPAGTTPPASAKPQPASPPTVAPGASTGASAATSATAATTASAAPVPPPLSAAAPATAATAHAAAPPAAASPASIKGEHSASTQNASQTNASAPASETPVPALNDIPAWEDDPQAKGANAALAVTPATTSTPATRIRPPVSPTAPAGAASSIEAVQSVDAGNDDFETMRSEDESYYDDARFVPAGMDDDDDGANDMPGGFALREAAGETVLPPGITPPARKKSKTPRLSSMTSGEWPALAAQLPLSGLAAELARQSEWLGAQGDAVRLRVAIRSLTEIQGKARLRTVLSEHFGTAVQLDVVFGHTGDETAHAVAQARRAERQKEAEQAVGQDPFVQSLISDFGAQVVPGSISAAEEKAA
ncbi:DNA polymerase III subunit gamma/tau [Pusillimonas sp. TS35]|nr:DNA polymerase III subunit gamma/tau [Pusillimonas sp. TS35]